MTLSTSSYFTYHLLLPLPRLLLCRVFMTAWRSLCTISPSPPCPSSSTASSTKTYLPTCSWKGRTCTKIMPTMRRSLYPGFSSGHFLVCCSSSGVLYFLQFLFLSVWHLKRDCFLRGCSSASFPSYRNRQECPNLYSYEVPNFLHFLLLTYLTSFIYS